MRLVNSGLFKKFYLFVGATPETHKLEITIFGSEKELKEVLNSVYLKCVGEVVLEKTPM